MEKAHDYLIVAVRFFVFSMTSRDKSYDFRDKRQHKSGKTGVTAVVLLSLFLLCHVSNPTDNQECRKS
jgi:hypothetical protein